MRNTSTLPLFNHKPFYDIKPKDTRQQEYTKNKPSNYHDLLKEIDKPMNKYQ